MELWIPVEAGTGRSGQLRSHSQRSRNLPHLPISRFAHACRDCTLYQGRSQDLVSGGGGEPISGGGATHYVSPQTPNHKGPPYVLLATSGFRGGAPPPLATPLPCTHHIETPQGISLAKTD